MLLLFSLSSLSARCYATIACERAAAAVVAPIVSRYNAAACCGFVLFAVDKEEDEEEETDEGRGRGNRALVLQS